VVLLLQWVVLGGERAALLDGGWGPSDAWCVARPQARPWLPLLLWLTNAVGWGARVCVGG